MTRGRPFQPGNKFGRGRPKGSGDKKKTLAHKVLEENSAAIMALAINRSRDDRQMLRMLASHIVPRQKNVPTKIGRLPLKTLEDLDGSSEKIIRKAASGKISLTEALDFFRLLEGRRAVLVSQDLDRRLSALEHPDQEDRAA